MGAGRVDEAGQPHPGGAPADVVPIVHHLDPGTDPTEVLRLGSFYQTMLGGLAAQWLVDPDRAPSTRDLTRALRTVAAEFTP